MDFSGSFDAFGDFVITAAVQPAPVLEGRKLQSKPSKPAIAPIYACGADSYALSADGTDFVPMNTCVKTGKPLSNRDTVIPVLQGTHHLHDDECVAHITIPMRKVSVGGCQSPTTAAAPCSVCVAPSTAPEPVPVLLPDSTDKRPIGSCTSCYSRPSSNNSQCSQSGPASRSSSKGHGAAAAAAADGSNSWWKRFSSSALNEMAPEQEPDRHSKEMRQVPYVGGSASAEALVHGGLAVHAQ